MSLANKTVPAFAAYSGRDAVNKEVKTRNREGLFLTSGDGEEMLDTTSQLVTTRLKFKSVTSLPSASDYKNEFLRLYSAGNYTLYFSNGTAWRQVGFAP